MLGKITCCSSPSLVFSHFMLSQRFSTYVKHWWNRHYNYMFFHCFSFNPCFYHILAQEAHPSLSLAGQGPPRYASVSGSAGTFCIFCILAFSNSRRWRSWRDVSETSMRSWKRNDEWNENWFLTCFNYPNITSNVHYIPHMRIYIYIYTVNYIYSIQ